MSDLRLTGVVVATVLPFTRSGDIVGAIYGAPPRRDMHTRIKEALRHLGVIDCAIPRAPLLPVSDDVAAEVARTVEEAGLGEFWAAS